MTDPVTGYGPRAVTGGRFARLVFDGDERKFEQWLMKFLGYMRLNKLKDVISPTDPATPPAEDFAEKNEEAYAELIQFLDDKSLSLVMRDAVDDGQKALKILKEHYAGKGKPRIIALYTELTTLAKRANESITDYVIRAETAAAALRDAGETVNDSLLVAMALKGLPDEYKSFVVVVTQSEKEANFTDFKVSLRSFDDTERARAGCVEGESIMKVGATGNSYQGQSQRREYKCYNCGEMGHIARNCRPKSQSQTKAKRWCQTCQSSTHNDSSCRKKKNPKDQVKQMVDSTDDEHSFAFRASDRSASASREGSLLVDCGATAHIVTDESKFVNFDVTFRPERHYIELADGTRTNNVAKARGLAKVKVKDDRGNVVVTTLKNALLIPSYPQDIFSVQAATEMGASVVFTPDGAVLRHKDGVGFDLERQGRLHYLNTFDHESDKVNVAKHDIQQWHEILGHCNHDDVSKLENLVEGMKITGSRTKADDCGTCVEGKMTQERSREPRVRSTVPLELVHTDLAGPINPVSKDGFKYAIAFTDDYSGTVFVYFLKAKSDTVKATEQFLADCAPCGQVKSLRSDNGTEFTSSDFKQLLRKEKIKHETSAPYSPHQNGTAERHWRTLFEMGRCLLKQAKLGQEFWPYAVMAAAYIRNRCYNKRIQQTPYLAMTGRKPDLSKMHVFGVDCYVYRQGAKKLDDRGVRGIFVGYDKASPAYLVYMPETGKVMKHRLVHFPKGRGKPFGGECSQMSDESDESDFDVGPKVGRAAKMPEIVPDGADRGEGEPAVAPVAAGRGEGEPAVAPVAPHRYPQRDRKMPGHLKDFDLNDGNDDDQMMTTIDYCYKVCSFPQNYAEAMSSPDSAQWKEAMDEEMNSLNENGTFTITTLPPGRKSIGGRWVFSVKEDSCGEETYKARFVAKGFSQTKNTDYYDTFAPTANHTSLRVLLQLAMEYDLILHQMDVKTAYLNAPIDCTIYMNQAEGYQKVSEDGEKLVYKLNKSLYGLKQAGRNWNNLLHSHLSDHHFEQNPVDPCLYKRQTERGVVILLIWVDDIIIAASNDELMVETKRMMNTRFKMKDLGKLKYFIGVEFDQGDEYIKVSQKRYLSKVLERFDMLNCKPRSTPAEQKLESDEDEEEVDSKSYREIIGSLVYAMVLTRPDICWIVTRLSQFLSKPRRSHWTAAKHVLRYLKGTLDYEMCFKKCPKLSLSGFSDADWGNGEDRRSVTGYCFSMDPKGPFISWKSRKQPTVALSTCEAEYMALAASVQEALYLRQLIRSLAPDIPCEKVLINEDNQGTIALANNPVNHKRAKHIDIRYHFIRDEIRRGRIVLKYCPTQDMVADVFTKPAVKATLEKFQCSMFG